MTESMDMDTKMKKFDEEIEQILDLLEEKAYFRARDEILKHNEVDIAGDPEEILEESGIDKTIIITVCCRRIFRRRCFLICLRTTRGRSSRASPIEKFTSWGELDFDDMIDVLEELPANIVDKILKNTEGRAKADQYISELSGHVRGKPDDAWSISACRRP